MIDLYRLRVFVAVYDAGSYTAAARVLGHTQPAISQHIAKLEDDYDVQLFKRHGRRMMPTPAADAAIQPARQTLAAAAVCEQIIGRQASG